MAGWTQKKEIFDSHMKDIRTHTHLNNREMVKLAAQNCAYDCMYCIPSDGETVVTENGLRIYRNHGWYYTGADGAYHPDTPPRRWVSIKDIECGLRSVTTSGSGDTPHNKEMGRYETQAD